MLNAIGISSSVVHILLIQRTSDLLFPCSHSLRRCLGLVCGACCSSLSPLLLLRSLADFEGLACQSALLPLLFLGRLCDCAGLTCRASRRPFLIRGCCSLGSLSCSLFSVHRLSCERCVVILLWRSLSRAAIQAVRRSRFRLSSFSVKTRVRFRPSTFGPRASAGFSFFFRDMTSLG